MKDRIVQQSTPIWLCQRNGVDGEYWWEIMAKFRNTDDAIDFMRETYEREGFRIYDNQTGQWWAGDRERVG